MEVVQEFEYLNSTISQDFSLDHEVDRRISKASRTFYSLYGVVWCRKQLEVQTKLRLFEAVVLATLLYGSETWIPLAPYPRRLQALVMGVYRGFWECHTETSLETLSCDSWVAWRVWK